MSYTREDWLELNESNRKKAMNGQRGNMEYLVQAQVKQSYLTANPDWDVFLSYLQNALNQLQGREQELRDALCSPSVVDTSAIMQLKLEIAEIVGQIKLLEGVLALPKDIIEAGDKAKALLD